MWKARTSALGLSCVSPSPHIWPRASSDARTHQHPSVLGETVLADLSTSRARHGSAIRCRKKSPGLHRRFFLRVSPTHRVWSQATLQTLYTLSPGPPRATKQLRSPSGGRLSPAAVRPRIRDIRGASTTPPRASTYLILRGRKYVKCHRVAS